MSFLSVLGKIGHVFHVVTDDAKPLVPAVSLIPGVGPIFATAVSAAVMLEALIPDPGNGAAKNPIATQITALAHPGVDQAEVSKQITNLVTAFNAIMDAEQALNAIRKTNTPAKTP